jgi:hypothetical protein
MLERQGRAVLPNDRDQAVPDRSSIVPSNPS